ncbi:MAG: ogr/Delta-like zinc finger family protein [Pseudohongiella sp.]|nr:ogr/Delta-like zinc finger family protein [Pseudohongiella sp.]
MRKHNDHYRPKRICPDCGGALRIRDSWSKHPLLHFEYVQCMDAECGVVYRVQREFTHLISPSGKPNPSVNLPRAPGSALKPVSNDTNQLQLINQGE